MPRNIVVTGASGGIGRATAIAFGRRKDTVVLVARGKEGLDGAAAEVKRAGGTAVVMSADVADPDQVFAVADSVEADIGPIDVWVNVAFTSVFSPFEKIRPDEYRRVTEVSYLGYVYATMAALTTARAKADKIARSGAANGCWHGSRAPRRDPHPMRAASSSGWARAPTACSAYSRATTDAPPSTRSTAEPVTA